jgi:hypothetical protein
LRFLIDLAMLPWSFESLSYWAYPYVKAFLDLIIVLQYFEFIIFALPSIYQITENANRSTFDLNEHRFSVNNFGNISVLLSTK